MPIRHEGAPRRAPSPFSGTGLRHHRWVLRWLPVVLWMVTVFTLSSLPQRKLPETGIPHADKIAHGAAYAVGGLLVARAVANPLAAILVPAIFGVADEWHQKSVPGRQPDFADWIADLVGALAGVLIYQWIRARRAAAIDPTSQADA